MADFELEDLQGNRYRLRRGSGPGLYHPENLCTGGNFDAERLLGHFSTSNIDDSFNHFYFDVLSKLDDRPSCPRQALTKAIAANYLTLEKIDTARAVDDEVPDDRPFLRVQIENALRQIVEGERREAAMHQRQMDKESTVMKGLIYTGAFMTGIGSSAWGLAVQVKELSDVINPFKKMEHHAKALRAAWESDDFADTYAETYLSGEKRELVEAIGFDPSQITQQQIDEAIAMTDLVLNDETLRDILYRFVKDYAEAQHAIEITEVAGSGAFELILTIIVAAVTGGAGVVAAVGSKMHLVRKFNKVGDLLADFAKATKQIKNRKKAFNGKNTGPGKLESVDGSVKKTDAHGAETGEVSKSVTENTWHTSDAAPKIQGVLNGIDPKYLNPDSRFGPAFYVGEEPTTTIAELAHHNVDAKFSIRFQLNKDAMNTLDLTDPEIAREWGYSGGPISSETKSIGAKAASSGYNVIRFPSERAPGGVNNAVLSDFNEILKPQSVSPVKL